MFWRVQHLDLGEQLNQGIRYFDLHVIYTNNHFYWHHQYVGSQINLGMKQIYQFAVDHPKEVVILAIWELLEMSCDGHTQPISIHNIQQLTKDIDKHLGTVHLYGRLNDCYYLHNLYDMNKNVLIILQPLDLNNGYVQHISFGHLRYSITDNCIAFMFNDGQSAASIFSPICTQICRGNLHFQGSLHIGL